MAYGGRDYSELDPLIPKDDDDKQEAETTQHFEPAHWSTPHHHGDNIEMFTMRQEKSGLPSYTAETSLGGKPTPSVDEISRRRHHLRRNTKSGILDISQVPETIENFLSEDEKNQEIENAKTFIKKIYPELNFKKLGPIEFSSKKGKSFDLVIKG